MKDTDKKKEIPFSRNHHVYLLTKNNQASNIHRTCIPLNDLGGELARKKLTPPNTSVTASTSPHDGCHSGVRIHLPSLHPHFCPLATSAMATSRSTPALRSVVVVGFSRPTAKELRWRDASVSPLCLYPHPLALLPRRPGFSVGDSV